MEEIFEWKRLLLGNLPLAFLLEVVFRTAVMFISLLIILKFSGKRGLKQLSVFELASISDKIRSAYHESSGDVSVFFYEDKNVKPDFR